MKPFLLGGNMDRFWLKVEKKDTGCWEWISSKDRAGYKVRGIRALNGTISQTKMASMFGVTQAAISGIILNKGWNHVR